MAAPTTKPLVPGIFLDSYRTQDKAGLNLKWIVRNETPMTPIQITFDFSGCSGMELNGPPKQESTVRPKETKTVADIRQKDVKAGCAVSCGYTYKQLPDDVALVAKAAETKAAEYREVIKKLEAKKITDQTPISEIISTCKTLGVKFVDKTFPPEMSSILGDSKDKGPLASRAVIWKRPEEFLKKSQLFEGIDPNDISQGLLGNCWFCCALSSLAEFPEYVKRMFETKEVNAAGVYRLRLFNETDVSPRVITVDDYFPCSSAGGPMFTSNKGEEMWVQLVEKAYAKLSGSYFNLREGDPADAFSDLTGCPVEEFEFEDPGTKAKIDSGEFWKILVQSDRSKDVMAASKKGKDTASESDHEQNVNKFGLIPGHAYSLIDVKEGLGKKLVKLRNPWGKTEWKGDWSDHSPLWTAEAKRVFKPELKDDDGAFYMSFEHFLMNFDSIDICVAATAKGKEWRSTRVKGSFGAHYPHLANHFYDLKISKQTCGYVSMFQADERIKGSLPPIDLGFFIWSCDKKSIAVTSVVKASNRLNSRFDLEAGHYIIIPFTPGIHIARAKDGKVRDFVLAIHADRKQGSEIKAVRADEALLSSARTESIKREGKVQKWDQHTIYSHATPGLSSFAVECGPMDGAKGCEFVLDFEGSTNVISAMGSLRIAKVVKPGEIALLQDLAPGDKYKGYGFKFKSSKRDL